MFLNPHDEPNSYSDSSYSSDNLALGKEILDRCTEQDVASRLTEMLEIPQIDGALYGIYYGIQVEGFIRGDLNSHVVIMHPKTLKSIMRACCAIGFYTQESISKADEIWNAPEKPKKIKYHYCFSCKANTVVDINERVCDSCKSISSGDSDQITYY